MNGRTMRFALIWLALLLALAACARSATPDTPTAPRASPTPPALEGTEWVLTLLNGKPLLVGTTITLSFGNGHASGRAGCNRYSWAYQESRKGTEEPDIMVSAMLCTGPAGVMEQEQAYIAVLRQARVFAVQGERLEVKNAAGETILVFQRR